MPISEKLLEVARFAKSCSKSKKLPKSCRAQSVCAYPPPPTKGPPKNITTGKKRCSWPDGPRLELKFSPSAESQKFRFMAHLRGRDMTIKYHKNV